MNEPIANATVVLVEKKGEGGGGLFSSSAACAEIASAVTDANGDCTFDNEKLKSPGKYSYFLGITNAYGQPQGYPCGGKTSGFLEKGQTQETILNASYFDGFIKAKYNNLLSPSQSGDTLYVRIVSDTYNVPGMASTFGGGGVLISENTQYSAGFPYPATFETTPIKTQCGKKIIYIRKRKMGVLTTSVDTVKIYPNQTKLIEINW